MKPQLIIICNLLVCHFSSSVFYLLRDSGWAGVMSQMMVPAQHTRRHGSAQIVDGFHGAWSGALYAVAGRGCQGAGEFREQRQRVTRTAAPSQRPSGSESSPDAKTAKLQACDLCSQRYPSEGNAPSLSTPVQGERRLCEAAFLAKSVYYSYSVPRYSVPSQTLDQRASASRALGARELAVNSVRQVGRGPKMAGMCCTRKHVQSCRCPGMGL